MKRLLPLLLACSTPPQPMDASPDAYEPDAFIGAVTVELTEAEGTCLAASSVTVPLDMAEANGAWLEVEWTQEHPICTEEPFLCVEETWTAALLFDGERWVGDLTQVNRRRENGILACWARYVVR